MSSRKSPHVHDGKTDAEQNAAPANLAYSEARLELYFAVTMAMSDKATNFMVVFVNNTPRAQQEQRTENT